MDLPSLQWQDHVAQKWTGLDPELREHFTSLCDIDDVFKCALTLTTQNDLDFVQSISVGHCVQKDAVQAAKNRENGNSSFKTREYTAAALHYSQGICFASPSSEQLSLCYANRSAALYHLQHYQGSLDDIDRALKNGYPSHLLHKLENRRAQCQHHLSVNQKTKEDPHNSPPVILKDPDRLQTQTEEPLSVGICPGAVVESNLDKGRHLVAKDRIAAGEVILNDRPYSCVLMPGMQEVKGKGVKADTGRTLLFGTEHRHCHRCLTETLCLVPCDGCSYSRYCSAVCQKEAWEEHHRFECPLGADLKVMGVMAQLALRVTLKAGLKNIQMAREKIKSTNTKTRQSNLNTDCSKSRNCCHTNEPDSTISFYGDSYLSVFHLMHHLSHHSPSLRFLCAVTVATIYLKLSRAGPPPALWDLSRPSGATSQSPDRPEEEGRISNWSPEHCFLGSAVLRHMLQLRCNAQAIIMLQDTGAANSQVLSSQEICIATAVFPTLSLLNHSCCPNTSLAFRTGVSAALTDLSPELNESISHGVTVTVRAAKVITAGQEILHCYGPHSSRMVIRERRRLLQEQYNFLCQCEACTSQLQQQEEEEEEEEDVASGRTGEGKSPHESKLQCVKCKGVLSRSSKDRGAGFMCSRSNCGHRISYSEVSHRLQEIRDDLEKAVDLMERERPDEALMLLKRTQCLSGGMLTDTHPLQGELEDGMARACATMGDWTNAASHLECSAAAVGSQYGEDSIEMGRQLFKLAQLHFNGGARSAALSVIPKVRRLLCLHCGPHCLEVQELQAMEECLRG